MNWYQKDKVGKVDEEFPHFIDLSELESHKLYFDDEVEQLFIGFTRENGNTQKKSFI